MNQLSQTKRKQRQILSIYIILQIFANLMFIVQLMPAVTSKTLNISVIISIVIINIGSIIVFFVFFRLFKKQVAQESMAAALQDQRDMQRKYMQELSVYASSINDIKEDLAEYVDTINRLVEENDVDKLSEYLSDYATNIANEKKYSFSNSLAVNSIISSKIALAEEQGISFSCNTTLEYDKVSEFDLCTILSNILDNAIEANENVKLDKKIILSFIKRSGYFNIICVNTYANKNISKPLSHKFERGLGLSIVKTVAEKNNGAVIINTSNDNYTISVSFLA